MFSTVLFEPPATREINAKYLKTVRIIFIQTASYDKNENIQAHKNRLIPVIIRLFYSEVVKCLHFNIKAFREFQTCL